jgi:hypothetical protein
MSSKNNPENRGRVTELRKYNGKNVVPVKFIAQGSNYIAAQDESGNLVMNPATGKPFAYKDI